jgi:hypothetical protein
MDYLVSEVTKTTAVYFINVCDYGPLMPHNRVVATTKHQRFGKG